MYWKRRALVGGIALLALILLWWLLWPKGSDPEPQPTAAPASTAGSPSSVPQTSGSPSPSPSGTAEGACADTDIRVAVSTDQQTYAAGVDPKLTMSITNTGALSCQRDIGSAANEISISSGGVQVWSSDDCSTSADPDIATLKPGEAATVTVDWQRTGSDAGCSNTGTPVAPGAYDAVGRNGKVQSAKTPFTLQ